MFFSKIRDYQKLLRGILSVRMKLPTFSGADIIQPVSPEPSTVSSSWQVLKNICFTHVCPFILLKEH